MYLTLEQIAGTTNHYQLQYLDAYFHVHTSEDGVRVWLYSCGDLLACERFDLASYALHAMSAVIGRRITCELIEP